METKGYWNRRGGYKKLDGSGCRRRKTVGNDVAEPAVEPTSSEQKRGSSWNKLLKVREAKKFCVGLRDAYVDFMIRNAGTKVMGEGIGGGYGGAVDDVFGVGSVKNVKEYDEKMIIETYKSVNIDHGNLAPRVGS